MTLAFLAVAVLAYLVATFFVLRPLARQTTQASEAAIVSKAAEKLHLLERERSEGTTNSEESTAALQQTLRDAVLEARGATDENAIARILTVIVGVLALLGVAASLYWPSGKSSPQALPTVLTPSGLPGSTDRSATSGPAPTQGREMDLARLAERLSDRLSKQPDDVQGWILMGRTYQEIGRGEDAVKAFSKAVALKPKDGAIQADVAEALFVAAGSNWTAEAKAALRSALQLDAKQEKALLLSGNEALSRGDSKAATSYWGKLIATAAADSPLRKQAESSLADMKGRRSFATEPAASPSEPLISGTVEVAEALRAQLRIGDILYVLARRTDGPPMPLAVKRYNGPEFPAKFTLDKDSIMVPGTDFAGARNLVLIARISHSGSPAAQAGDLEGQIALGGPRANLKVLIDHQVK